MKHRKRSRIQFQPQFLVGALSALSLSATACGALVADGPGGDSNDASDGAGGTDGSLDGESNHLLGPGCPAVKPEIGTACTEDQVGVGCGTFAPCTDTIVVCGSDLVWYNGSPSCNPPPTYECPDYAPPIGSACDEPGVTCREATCAGDAGIVCGIDGTWQEIWMSCNPPPIGYGGSDALGGSSGTP